MMYFKICPSIRYEEVGVFTQIQTPLHNNSTYEELYPSPSVDGKIADDFQFATYKMHHLAKWTDYISCVFLDDMLLISARALSLFKSKNIADFQAFPVPIVKGKKEIVYNAFFIPYYNYKDDFIDWEKSRFSIAKGYEYVPGRQPFRREIAEIQVQNLDDYRGKVKKIITDSNREQSLVYKVIAITQKIQLDLFRVYGPEYNGYYCSENFKESIQNAGLTGFSFTEIPTVLQNTNIIV